ncbi:MAG: transposase [Anaerolineales bacterium]|uniref:transposase n=1 Tax=Candidatus Villigracilis affinis TaxID=3140682 RepID=UPI001D587018|nr:transposase [Anaerolineales bacterium]MBK9602926.1 transposase [Anaerolineales bacterium]
MPADILVVTSSSQLGESVRRILEETDLYRIHVVNNKSSAIVRADEVGAPLSMLDLALGEGVIREIGHSLRTIRPGINIIILCDENVTPPPFDELRPWILVRKPFKMSNFMTAISQPQPTATTTTATPAATPPQSPANPTLPWLSDPTRAAQHLTRLTLESSAQAALITRKSDLWAYAGSLSQSAAKEVAQTITRNWDGQKGFDLLRFIRLESTKAEHMLYATRLAADTVLALVFDAETPFSTIRAQASQLVTNLDNEALEPQKPIAPFASEKQAVEANADTDDDDEPNIPPISDILNNVPAPNPEPATTRDFNLPRKKEVFDPNQTRVSESLSNASVFKREASPSVHYGSIPVLNKKPAPIPEVSAQPKNQTVLDEVDVTAPSRIRQRPETPVVKPAPGELDVTRESPTTEAARKLVVEPTTAGLYHLTYACLLVPRFSAHYLTGDLADQVGEWLPNICIAFGWRLEFLSVRPEYLQWVVNVQPNTSPGYLMRIMRQQTSEKIFTDFTRLKRENPSGDFWAPGYLIMGGTQPHPQQLVRDYIRQTRQRQGQEIPSEPRRK